MNLQLYDTHIKLVSQDERKAAMDPIRIQDCKHKIWIYVYVTYLKLLSLVAHPASSYNAQLLKIKKPHIVRYEVFRFKKGSDLLSHINAVPSAQLGLTSLFGMGRGEPQCYNHPKLLVISLEF